MHFLLTKAFWHGIWIWCKANWKFILGFSIPVVLSIIWRKGNATAIMKKGIEVRNELIESERKAAGLEIKLKDEATDGFVDSMKDLQEKYDKDLKKIEAEKEKAESRDLSPEEASKELADRFDLRLTDDEDDK